jgi:predicted metal-dependent enzyme (double-stranded beta helix superfamily)
MILFTIVGVQVDSELGALIARLDAAVDGGDPEAIVHRVKAALQAALRANDIELPARFRRTRPDTYARRLLHRDPAGRYTAVVMTWGAGQGTSLHDHSGLWCVDCVVDGEIAVTQFDLVGGEGDGGAYTFAPQTHVTACRGEAGCLIPPFEYHTLANASADHTSLTLHVYGGEMSQCHVFEPAGDGSYRRVTRDLSYDE